MQVEIDRPQKLSRLLIFVKWLLAIPHFIALYVLLIVGAVVILFSWVVTIITGKVPQGAFDYLVGMERWRLRVGAYLMLQTDAYPPFSLADDPNYPARLQVAYPERVARWRPLLTWLLVLPAAIVLIVVGLFAFLAVILAWFAILITGRYPAGIFNLVSYVLTLGTKVVLYEYWLTPEYPIG